MQALVLKLLPCLLAAAQGCSTKVWLAGEEEGLLAAC
jgi:hypothetical protein